MKETTFKSRLLTIEIENTRNFKDMRQFLDSSEKIVNGNIRIELARNELKVNIVVFAGYKRGTDEYQEMNFKTQNEIITKASDLAEFYSKAKNKILIEIEEFEIRGSQWILNRILKIELRINKYNPLRVASYISLPEVLTNKKAIINVQNEDNKCFMWSILSALHPADKHSDRVSKYKQWENELS